MSQATVVFDTPESIEFFQLASLKAAVSLECKGLRRSRGPSAVTTAKQRYGLTGDKNAVLAKLQNMVDAAIAAKREK